MKYIYADYLVLCDEKFTIINDGAIAFDKTIKFVGSKDELQAKYENINLEYMGENSIIMPGLINSHIHLEFSANKTTLKYGDFIKWLFSVIENREQLITKATTKLIKNEITKMVQNGTTTIGAISSYGLDLEAVKTSQINTVYFTEVLGSKPDMIDTLFLDFKEKLKKAISYKNDKFIPAIAIHSPYSTHPFLIREVLKIAQKEDMSVSAHFLESKAENEWLSSSSGDFVPFFKNILNQTKSLTTPQNFLEQFKEIKNLSFTHCVEASEEELNLIKDLKASVIHCPNSNRILTNSKLDLDRLDNINLAIGTDGLSSNYTLNLFEELKNALFVHTAQDMEKLAQKLILASTLGGAKALGLTKKGSLKVGYDSDIISFKLKDKPTQDIATHIILNSYTPHYVFIGGENELS